jgi:hypothetical protein
MELASCDRLEESLGDLEVDRAWLGCLDREDLDRWGRVAGLVVDYLDGA